MEELKNFVKKIDRKIITNRRNLHQIPEIGLNLPKTKNYIINELKKLGFEIKEYKSCSGIGAKIGKGIKKVNCIKK